MNKYLKFEYWNTCDLGNIYYQGGQKFLFYLDGDVLEPFHEDTEDGQEDGEGDFIATYRRQMKRYRIRTALVPDYLVDAMQRMKLHDNIWLTFKTGEIERVYNVDVEVDWQFEKYCWQGTVVLTFDMDEKVIIGACCDNLTVTPYVSPLNSPAYFISTTGDDTTGDGSITSPWKTINHGWSELAAGDTLYIRGGTYTYAIMGKTSISGKDGTASSYINIWNYPGETVIINFSDFTPSSWDTAFLMASADYIHIKGIRITNLGQSADGDYISKGFSMGNDCNYCYIENVEVDHIGGQGFTQESPSAITNITFLNCDSHHNSDPYSDTWGAPYGSGDGFVFGGVNNDNIIFRACRAWSNSDDGWDLRNSNANIIIDSCWSFWNGYIPDTWTTGGDGIGFKLGGKTAPATVTILRSVYNSIAFKNRVNGFDPQPDANDLYFSTRLYNCVAYDNDLHGFYFNWYIQEDVLRNCIGYANGGNNFSGCATTDDAFCSWNGFTVTDADFLSVSSVGADGSRQSDFSLPQLSFLHLAASSSLVNAGTYVALSEDCDGDDYNVPPSIGAFEL